MKGFKRPKMVVLPESALVPPGKEAVTRTPLAKKAKIAKKAGTAKKAAPAGKRVKHR
jgi:hypothetical protein